MNKHRITKTNFSKKMDYNLPNIQQNPYNQTIIINNPHFNINYIQSSRQHQTIDPKYTRNDNWNLNRNLKEFSQTKQLGFFHSKNKNLQKNSPEFILPKNNKQELRNLDKNSSLNTIRTDNKKSKSIPYVPINNSPSRLDNYQDSPYGSNAATIKILNNNHTTIFKDRKSNYTQRNPRQLISQSQKKQLEKYPQKKFCLELLSQRKQEIQKRINLRKNRFSSQEKETKQQHRDYVVSHPTNEQEQSQSDYLLRESSKIDMKNTVKIQFKKTYSHCNKAIEIIHSSLLSNIDNYLDYETHQEVAPSKIQFYVSSMKQPEIGSINSEYKSTPLNIRENNDFQFEEEKIKLRTKTPFKRKNFYNS